MTLFLLKRSSFISGIMLLGLHLMALNVMANIERILFTNHYLCNSNTECLQEELANNTMLALPYFPKIYDGVGIEHMNINLVNLKETGLNEGDEVGVFDGEYCVGALVITEKHMLENSMSIPASANNSITSKPNGYTSGHKITLKAHRTGIVHLLYFQTVNNSLDIFERGGSMFALVDLSRSTGQSLPELFENIRIYPNPFTSILKIDIIISKRRNLTVSIYDLNGKPVRKLFEGKYEGSLNLTWDGKNDNHIMMVPGVYFCRINESTYKIIYQGISIN